jgi:hypothetical protein
VPVDPGLSRSFAGLRGAIEMANVASPTGRPSSSTAQAASVALWVSMPIAVTSHALRVRVPMDAGRMGRRAFSVSCSYEATPDPLDR